MQSRENKNSASYLVKTSPKVVQRLFAKHQIRKFYSLHQTISITLYFCPQTQPDLVLDKVMILRKPRLEVNGKIPSKPVVCHKYIDQRNWVLRVIKGKKAAGYQYSFCDFCDSMFDLLYTLEMWIRWFSKRSSVCEKLRDHETFFITVQFFKSSMRTKIWPKKHFFYLFCNKLLVWSNVR